jgi:non-canonical purine NTP pyrophosphatase (RdgB/HAM1 family)
VKIKNLLLITGNEGKYKEFRDLININELILSYRSIDLLEIQSFEIKEIGYFKTKSALAAIGLNSGFDAVLTDDTGLYCEALNGLPGPLIKWFLVKLGAKGIYDLIRCGNGKTTAICLLSLGLVSTGEIIQFEGEVKGQLVAPRGGGGFGWDQVFLPNSEAKTYGEMTADEKNNKSHRSLAVNKLREWLLTSK